MVSDAERLDSAIGILLEGMDSMAQLARGWHPDEAATLVEAARPVRLQLGAALAELENASWPEDMRLLREPCLEATRILLGGEPDPVSRTAVV